jgi:hypothetical protein
MTRRRPPSPGRSGVVACAVLALPGLLGGCAVDVESPDLEGADAQNCRALVAAVPDSVDGAERREVSPEDAYAAAWGDPAIVLRCGVEMPASFDETASCQVTNGVGWFIPEDQITGSAVEITMTTIGRAQNVEVVLPPEHFPPAAAMVDLAAAISETVPEVRPCV